MIFRGDNHNEQFFAVAMLPWLSIPFFAAVFSSESTILGKIIAGILGLTVLIIPIRSYIKKRYEIILEEKIIRIVYTSKYVQEKTYSYDELELIKFTNPPRGRNHIIFNFKGKGRRRVRFFVELENRTTIIPIIIHCKSQNKETKYEALPIRGELFNYIKSELYKESLK